jgi:chaperonin cofactor prefoldin
MAASGNEKAIVARFQEMRAELTQIWNKITELDMERNEHTLVLNAIQPLDASRKCFRLIGGVLVERTVGEVLPAVTRNKEGIEQVGSLDPWVRSLSMGHCVAVSATVTRAVRRTSSRTASARSPALGRGEVGAPLRMGTTAGETTN